MNGCDALLPVTVNVHDASNVSRKRIARYRVCERECEREPRERVITKFTGTVMRDNPPRSLV